MEVKQFLKKYAHLHCCTWFSDLHLLYVLVLDCLAVGYRNTRELAWRHFFKETTRDQFNNERVFYFEADYAIPHIMFVYDIFICLAVLVGLIITCACCGLKKSWYYVLLGPFSCVVVHYSYWLHTRPHHASAILIFMQFLFLYLLWHTELRITTLFTALESVKDQLMKVLVR